MGRLRGKVGERRGRRGTEQSERANGLVRRKWWVDGGHWGGLQGSPARERQDPGPHPHQDEHQTHSERMHWPLFLQPGWQRYPLSFC